MNTIQRTLIITMGPLSAESGSAFLQLCQQQQTPTHSIALLHAAKQTLEPAALQEALTQISTIESRQQLLAAGWQRDAHPEIDLVLIADCAQDAVQQLFTLTDQIEQQTQQQVGVELSTLVFWLAPSACADEAKACLNSSQQQQSRFQRGVFALTLGNELGLQLPDSAALIAATADALWALTATPLKQSVTHLLNEDDEPLLNSVGVRRWSWSRDTVQQAVTHLWLHDVLAAWQIADSAVNATATALRWANTLGCQPDQIAAQLLTQLTSDIHWRLPVANQTPWRMPNPWRMRALKQKQLDSAEQDQTTLPTLSKQQAEISDMLATKLQNSAETQLNQTPHIPTSIATLRALQCDFETTLETILDQQHAAQDDAAYLAQEIIQQQDAWQIYELDWPQPALWDWFCAALSAWRWPTLGYTYLRLKKCGQRLTHLHGRQAQQRRQAALIAATISILEQCQATTAHLIDQVEEISDMLTACARTVAAAAVTDPQINDNGKLGMLSADTLQRLYHTGGHDIDIEAGAAAHAVGGLGRHIQQLNDDFLTELQAYAQTQTDWLKQHNAQSLIAHHHASAEEHANWWQLFNEAAAPLWQHDEVQLSETMRDYTRRAQFTYTDNPQLMLTLTVRRGITLAAHA